MKKWKTGQAEVRQLFKVSKVGTIAGCYVTSGVIKSNSKVRVLRAGAIVYEGKLSSLKRFQNDVKDVALGYECGITIERFNDLVFRTAEYNIRSSKRFNDLKEKDIIEAYEDEEIKRD